MAGNSKPNVDLSIYGEANYVINDSFSKGHQINDVYTGKVGRYLFDGLIGAVNNNTTFIWMYNTTDFVDITIGQSCNIWTIRRQDLSTGTSYCAPLIVKKYNTTTKLWETTSIVDNTTVIAKGLWTKSFINISAGRYRFEKKVTANRYDTEWYLEALEPVNNFSTYII